MPDGSGVAGATWALLAAAGSGERLGIDRPKAFAVLGGRPLVAESLDRLDRCELGRLDRRRGSTRLGGADDPARRGARCFEGRRLRAGRRDACGVRCGSTLRKWPEEAVVVLVHDAARPLLGDEVVERVLGPLGEGFDGAVPAIPISDTVKRVARRRGDRDARSARARTRLRRRRRSSPSRCGARSRGTWPTRPTARRSSSVPVAGSRSWTATPAF